MLTETTDGASIIAHAITEWPIALVLTEDYAGNGDTFRKTHDVGYVNVETGDWDSITKTYAGPDSRANTREARRFYALYLADYWGAL